MCLIDHIIHTTTEYVDQMPKAERKKYGQFFTSKETAVFMASLFDLSHSTNVLRVLDPGAGSGVLSSAIIDRIQEEGTAREVELVCYENDHRILNLLKSNLMWIVNHASISVTFEIRAENYITYQALDYNEMIGANPCPEKYDIIIGNPPYMKLLKNAPEALSMPDVCHGAPNLYFLFATMSLFNLASDCEMVYIIPRSWTSGTYFKAFRKRFLADGALEHIHLFVSRDKVFEAESVLQETIIIKVRKTSEKPRTIKITTTRSNSDFSDITSFEAPYHSVVSGSDLYVFLITCKEDAKTLETLSQWNDTLPTLGLKMKTGLTVDFRNREVLRNAPGEKIVPLFYSQHIQNGEVVFPTGLDTEYIVTERTGLLQNNSNYLFVKRFTAKEEKRRLQCGVYLSRKFPEYSQISTQNKINFISGTNELSECTVYGLYVILNSTVYDRYYRILNGSTQVNSTEVNSMPMPPINAIEEMGKQLMCADSMSEQCCNQILGRYINGKTRGSQKYTTANEGSN